MKKLDLPIGESSFQNIREWDFYYVDKTAHVFNLARKPGYYFLSRPRRFGKTLLVDTMQELFEGNEKLFRGLYIHDRWDWTVSNPVVRLSFDAGYREPDSLENHIFRQVAKHEEHSSLKASPLPGDGPQRFQDLIIDLHDATKQKVVVLVDEYDKPILDLLESPSQARPTANTCMTFMGSSRVVPDTFASCSSPASACIPRSTCFQG